MACAKPWGTVRDREGRTARRRMPSAAGRGQGQERRPENGDSSAAEVGLRRERGGRAVEAPRGGGAGPRLGLAEAGDTAALGFTLPVPPLPFAGPSL